jgi:hypothetical protein
MAVARRIYHQFITALELIVKDEEGTWQDKKAILMEIAREEGAEGAINELVSWFPDSDPEETPEPPGGRDAGKGVSGTSG